jgi:aryl-alcohol dehydrogenase-like predicted oxidoreductase
MEYRQLGRSGLRISKLTLGTMTLGGRGKFALVGQLGLKETRRFIDRSLDAGVNLIDTADVYSDGRSEELVGEALVGRRADVLIATKVYFPSGSGPNDAGLSRSHILAACEASLRRLRTDYVDLYQIHEWDGRTPLEETLDALDTLVHQGKVRYIGCSNYSAWHLMKALCCSDRLQLQRFVSEQICYSLLAREVEYELIPVAIDQGLGVLVWGPLASGLLSGKYRRGKDGPPGARHTDGWNEPPIRDWTRAYDIIDRLIEVAEKLGVSPAQVALAYLLGKPTVTSVIIGARTEQQLVENLAAADLQLSAEDRMALDRSSMLDLLYPYWHQAAFAAERLSLADATLLQQPR